MSNDIAVSRRALRFHSCAGVLTVVLPAFLAVLAVLAVFSTPLAAQVHPSAARTAQPVDTAGLSVQIDSLLDLQTVIRRALDVSPDVAAGDAAIRNAQSEGRVAAGAYVPQLAANSSVLRSDVTSAPVAGAFPPSSYSAGLSSSIDLFTGGRRGADRTRARADLTAAQADNVSRRFSVTLEAQHAYYETLRASDLVDVARARVAQGERGYRYAQDRVRAGTATHSDELRARLELTSGQQQLVAALDTLQTSAYALGRLVGANGPVGGVRDSAGPGPLALTDSEIVRLAVDASPSVRAARANEEASTAASKSARTLYVPDLKLIGGYNWANQTEIVGGTRPGWSLGVGTSFPLFNGFQREDEISRADAAAEVAHVSSLDVTRQARTEAARLISGLRFADRNISLSNQAVQSAEEDLRVQNERYQAGISTELDQLNSELALIQARLGLVAARFNYLITRAQLEALIGRAL